jgi:hypothetical protein
LRAIILPTVQQAAVAKAAGGVQFRERATVFMMIRVTMGTSPLRRKSTTVRSSRRPSVVVLLRFLGTAPIAPRGLAGYL